MKKSDLLEALKETKVDNGPKSSPKLVDKNVLIDALKNKFTPKADGKGKLMDNIKNINPDLAKPEKDVKMESTWKPAKTTIRELTERVIMEAEGNNNQPNAFRLNIDSIVMDKHHSKFSIMRGDVEAIIELLYPNAKEQISVKIQVDGAEDRLLSVDLEDDAYRGDFGSYLLQHIDDLIEESSQVSNVDYGEDGMAFDSPVGGQFADGPAQLTGGSPIWESAWNDAFALVEADDEEDSEEDSGDDIDIDLGDESGDAGEAFDEGDFSMDASGDLDMGDFPSDFGGAVSGDAGDVNSDEEGMQGGEDEDTEYMQFRDKDDWLNSSLDAMQSLTAKATSDQMQDGNGVILTSDEVLNGTTGISSDTNYEVVDKFLKVYPELDGVDIPVDMMEQIEDKLALNDDQFDAFLQQKLPEITGSSEVDDVLNNDMFDSEIELGGSPEESEFEMGSFDDFLDDVNPDEMSLDDDDDGEDSASRREAELDVGGIDLDEFPNL